MGETDGGDSVIMGWREWVGLPELGIDRIKAKSDTGARTSVLHAESIRAIPRRESRISFVVYPFQNDRVCRIEAEVELVDERWVTSSNGDKQLRPVIRTAMKAGRREWSIELTLTNRDVMGFRMLLGREAMQNVLVDPSRSYLLAP